jgi:ADP-ribosylglycohydrolase
MDMEEFLRSKFRGTAVGAALGAAMGKAVAEIPADAVMDYYGKPISGFVKSHPSSPYDFLKPEEVPAEVELFKLALESLIEAKTFDPHYFAAKLIKWLDEAKFHRYVNPTLLNVLRALKEGEPPEEVYYRTSSISAILHTVSMGMFHYDYPTLAGEGAKLMALILARGKEVEEGAQVIGVATALFIEGDFDLSEKEQKIAFVKEVIDSCTELEQGKKYLEKVIEALERNLKHSEAVEFFGNGEYIWESLPLALFLTLRDMEYPQRAFLNAVNSYGRAGGATHAIGFLVGGWLGAYWGVEIYPPQWVEKVEYSKELLELADKLLQLLSG